MQKKIKIKWFRLEQKYQGDKLEKHAIITKPNSIAKLKYDLGLLVNHLKVTLKTLKLRACHL